MNAVEKALWFIESHSGGEITLLDIANTVGVSRLHMAQAFGAATGLMRYVSGRRLTEAAKALSHGAPDILSVALDAGYGSHEAFTRAFRDEFGDARNHSRPRKSEENRSSRAKPKWMKHCSSSANPDARRAAGGCSSPE